MPGCVFKCLAVWVFGLCECLVVCVLLWECMVVYVSCCAYLVA